MRRPDRCLTASVRVERIAPVKYPSSRAAASPEGRLAVVRTVATSYPTLSDFDDLCGRGLEVPSWLTAAARPRSIKAEHLLG